MISQINLGIVYPRYICRIFYYTQFIDFDRDAVILLRSNEDRLHRPYSMRLINLLINNKQS